MSEIDTKTTAGKIAVMQAYLDGKTVESINLVNPTVAQWKPITDGLEGFRWNWDHYDFRIAPDNPDPYAEAKAAWRDGELQVFNLNEGKWQDWDYLSKPEFDGCPEHYRRRPKTKRVPLGPEDVPPGSVFRHETIGPEWVLAESASQNNVVMPLAGIVNYKTLMEEGYEIKRLGEDWAPCWKEVEDE